MNRTLRSFLLGLSILIGLSSFSNGKTIVEKRENELQRFVPLKKMTVGPYDNYQVDINPSSDSMIFTRKIDLVPRVFIKNRNQNSASPMLKANQDAEHPSFSPDGGKIALTYYGNTARGQICIFNSKGVQIFCAESMGSESSLPDWINNEQVGFLSKAIGTNTSQIKILSLKDKTVKTIASGNISSFDFSNDGKELAYTETDQGESRLKLVNVAKGASSQISLQLNIPGVSGFPRFGVKGKYLYLNHYLNDTNRDQIIDGNDDSAIFRIDVSVVRSRSNASDIRFLPEQLTSLESNCGFPRPTDREIFVACGFQGSLDIYTLPLSGVVPVSWTQREIWDAHKASRSYLDRLLLLNAGIVRTNSLSQDSFYLRRLSNHVLSENYSAALEILEELQAAIKTPDLFALEFFVRATKAQVELEGGEVTRSFKRFIAGLQSQLFRTKVSLQSKKILISYFNFLVGKKRASRQSFVKTKLSRISTPSEVFVFNSVARTLFSNSKDYKWRWSNWISELLKRPFLSEESRTYYVFDFVNRMTSLLDSRQKQTVLESLQQKLATHSEVKLIESELLLMKLTELEDAKEKRTIFQSFVKLSGEAKNNYFLQKAIYIRALLEFASIGDAQYLNYIATNWFNTTKKQQAEFHFARSQYIYAMLDRGYKNHSQGKIRYSTSQFYGSLLYTDDLESHYSYIQSMFEDGQRGKIDQRYEYLQKKNFIGENFKFVKALLLLIDDPTGGRDKAKLNDSYDLLSSMESSRFSAVRELMLGWIQMRKVELSKTLLTVDEKVFSKAHNHLTLALDLSRDNERVRASALGNLGLLHFYGRNFGVSARYFEKRKDLPFASSMDQWSFIWMYSRSLFYNYLPKRSYSLIMNAIENLKLPNPVLAKFYERAGFYALNAGRFLDAKNAYENFLGQELKLETSQEMKVLLSYGYALYKLRNFKQAREVLSKSYMLSSQSSAVEAQRIKTLSSGLLVNLKGSAKPLQDIKNNWSALSELEKSLDKIFMKKVDWLEYRLRNRVKKLEVYSKNPEGVFKTLGEVSIELKSFNDEKGSRISNASYRSLLDGSLALVMTKRKAPESWIELLQETIGDYKELKSKQVGFEANRIKLTLVSQYLQNPSGFNKWFEAYSQGQDSQFLQSNAAPRWQSIKSFAKLLPLAAN